MFIQKLKTTIEIFTIAGRLGYYHGREPLAEHNYAMYNKDRSYLFMWTGDKLLSKKASDVHFLETVPHITKDFKVVWTVRKDSVTIAE